MTNIQTKIIHDSNNRNRFEGLINPAISRTSTVLYKNYEDFWEDEKQGFSDKSYGRAGTATTKALANALSNMAGVEYTIITSSGMSAITTSLLSLLQPGDSILVPDNIYVCTRRFLDEELAKLNIEVIYYDPLLEEGIRDFIKDNTKILYLESPGSGTFEVQNLPLLTSIAKEKNIITILDDSWATSLNLPSFKLGVDITVSSLTKYINGHSDVFLGAISTNNPEIYQQLYCTLRNLGGNASPDDCYLALRGMRTLATRLKTQSESSIEIAKWLENQPQIIKVMHPALPSFSTHHLWKRDFKGSSATFSFIIDYDVTTVKKFVNRLKLFGIGLSWGGYESLIMPLNLRKYRRYGWHDYQGEVIRLHIGLENPQDLIIDLKMNMQINN